MYSLFNMPHHNSTARIPQSLITPRHQPLIAISSSTFTTTSQVASAAENFNNSAKLFFSPKQTSRSIYLSMHLCVHLPHSAFFLPSSLLVQKLHPEASLLTISSSLHQCSSTPHRHPRCLTPVLHITHPKKGPPCILCSGNGEIPAAKLMTTNKTKLNLKNMLCSH